MHANLLAQGDNISGDELRGRGVVAWTIAAVTREELDKIGRPGEKTKRGRFTFKEPGSKPWICNVTNKKILIAIFGGGRCGKQAAHPDEHKDGGCYQTDHWIGHLIALGATKQRTGNKDVDGIVVVGCDSLTAPMDVEVTLVGKGTKTYKVHPPAKKAPTSGGNPLHDPNAQPPAGQ